jgi:hypothetical protein
MFLDTVLLSSRGGKRLLAMGKTLAYQATNLTRSVIFFFNALITISLPVVQFLSCLVIERIGLAFVLPVVFPLLLFTKTRVFLWTDFSLSRNAHPGRDAHVKLCDKGLAFFWEHRSQYLLAAALHILPVARFF